MGLKPKSPKLCGPKTAQINTSFCKTSFFPAMKSGSDGGGMLAPPPPRDAELLSNTLPDREVGGGAMAPGLLALC